MTSYLPHFTATLNLLVLGLIVAARFAIKRGDRVKHRNMMLSAGIVGLGFIASYGTQTWLAGHQRFPGDDWVRSVFLAVLGTHTVLAVLIAPTLAVAYFLAFRQRFDAHRRVVRIAWPVWMYVTVTGLFIYVMNNWVRPV